MKDTLTIAALAIALALGGATAAWAGAPQPDERAGDFTHVCKGGANKDQACTVANEATDCPKSECVIKTLSKTISGTLTIIADDLVVDWATGVGLPRALTLMLEVKAPDGSKQILAETYQNLGDLTNLNSDLQLAPTAPSNVVAIGMDEFALQNLATDISGLMFSQPETTMANQLKTLFGATGTPVLVGLNKKSQFADHTGDNLASVLRFKVKIQFLEPV